MILLLCLSCLVIGLRYWLVSKRKIKAVSSVYDAIVPFCGDWRSQEPVQLRDFKTVYHLTMGLSVATQFDHVQLTITGLQSCTLNDLILMDHTYEAKIKLRRKILESNFHDVVGSNPVGREAVSELYQWLFSVYLPRRFPDAFRLIKKRSGSYDVSQVKNLIMDETISLDRNMPAEECLATMGQHIDCEFAILLPVRAGDTKAFRAMPTNTPTELYHLHAFVLIFPSGFNTTRKLGLSLAGIHGPVPGYATKLEKSMDRYFANLPFGKVVQRSNWSVSTDGNLFKLGDMHTDIRKPDVTVLNVDDKSTRIPTATAMAPATYEASADDELKWQEASKIVDPEKCSLRLERQTLHRLERTGALVFGFKTYLNPLSRFKEEGLGPQLAETLGSLGRGSVPAMDVYKDGIIWKEPLIQYLTT